MWNCWVFMWIFCYFRWKFCCFRWICCSFMWNCWVFIFYFILGESVVIIGETLDTFRCYCCSIHELSLSLFFQLSSGQLLFLRQTWREVVVFFVVLVAAAVVVVSIGPPSCLGPFSARRGLPSQIRPKWAKLRGPIAWKGCEEECRLPPDIGAMFERMALLFVYRMPFIYRIFGIVE